MNAQLIAARQRARDRAADAIDEQSFWLEEPKEDRGTDREAPPRVGGPASSQE